MSYSFSVLFFSALFNWQSCGLLWSGVLKAIMRRQLLCWGIITSSLTKYSISLTVFTLYSTVAVRQLLMCLYLLECITVGKKWMTSRIWSIHISENHILLYYFHVSWHITVVAIVTKHQYKILPPFINLGIVKSFQYNMDRIDTSALSSSTQWGKSVICDRFWPSVDLHFVVFYFERISPAVLNSDVTKSRNDSLHYFPPDSIKLPHTQCHLACFHASIGGEARWKTWARVIDMLARVGGHIKQSWQAIL